jgi:PAS domain S-box-containing protein
MSRFIRPEPVDREIVLDPSKVIMSKTDAKGQIEYANEYFMEICGYIEYELMGRPHNVIRHPDMPRVVFKLLWERLHKGKNIHALVKNLAKDGRYYWVITDFETKYNDDATIRAHYSRRKAAPKKAVTEIEGLYKILCSLEENDRTLKLSANYLNGLLEENNTNYDDFILSLMGLNEQEMMAYFRDVSLNDNASNFQKTTTPLVNENPVVLNEENLEIEEIKDITEIKKITEVEEAVKVKKRKSFFARLFS